jgi:hypothetical protein
VRSGGLFLVIVGAAIVAGGLLGPQWMYRVFAAGFGAAFVALALFRRRLTRPLGVLTRTQRLAMPAAISLEIALIILVLLVFRADLAQGQTRNFTLAILLAVGVHFLVFALSSGPLMLWLAALCCANALLGMAMPTLPLAGIWIADGSLKLAVGIVMLRTAVAARASLLMNGS